MWHSQRKIRQGTIKACGEKFSTPWMMVATSCSNHLENMSQHLTPNCTENTTNQAHILSVSTLTTPSTMCMRSKLVREEWGVVQFTREQGQWESLQRGHIMHRLSPLENTGQNYTLECISRLKHHWWRPFWIHWDLSPTRIYGTSCTWTTKENVY